MANLNSANVIVYPSVNRDQDPGAQYTTEYNLTSIINKLLDRKAFVISHNIAANKLDIEFNIFGYYFYVKNFDLSDDTASEDGPYLNASINVTYDEYPTSAEFTNYQTLVGTDSGKDSNSTYDGISLDWSADDRTSLSSKNSLVDGKAKITYTFTILEYKNGGYQVPEDCKLRFETKKDNTSRALKIDDGELDPEPSE